ncbi:MAG: methane monooxygenase/ammonia monooxygenase subunit B [Methylococcaceae bacterium]|nr:methane monooxygenase/ammonia monooxygenase subunit B [Methylococcaceae bacterium]
MSINLKNRAGAALLALVCLAVCPEAAMAHGEKALEPFIRMRTIQWYDVEWNRNQVQINDQVIITGKFHVAEDWPRSVPKPDAAYLNVAIPGPVFVRTERYLNGQPWVSSAALQPGGDYEFKIVLKARLPGRYHIHPFFNLQDAGAVMGPGQWVEVTGIPAAFTNPVKTLDGEIVELETYGLANGVFWHLLWIGVGTAWLLWWVRRPLFIPRYKMLQSGSKEALITPLDKTIAGLILVTVPLCVLGAYAITESRYPNTIPLQAALDHFDPLPPAVNDGTVQVELLRSQYRVPERSMELEMRVRNRSGEAIRIGEYATANLRFVNPETGLPAPDPNAEGPIAREGLRVVSKDPIQPGETRKVRVVAADALWETEKLEGLFRDADSRSGALLFLYGATGKRYIASISSAVIPRFD